MPDQQSIVENSSGKTSAETSLSRITFGLGSSVLSISAGLVSEIIQPLAVTPLPNCPGSVEGVAVLRGELVALLNIRSILNLPQPAWTQRSKWIVISASPGSTQFAFPVDRLVGIAAAEQASGKSPEPSAPKKPDFPALDINSIVSQVESALPRI